MKEIYLSQLLIISKIVMDNIVSENGQNHPNFETNESGQNTDLFVMTKVGSLKFCLWCKGETGKKIEALCQTSYVKLKN